MLPVAATTTGVSYDSSPGVKYPSAENLNLLLLLCAAAYARSVCDSYVSCQI